MAKRDDKHSMAQDYLAQLDQQSRQSPPYRGHRPWPSWTSNEPNWKYKKNQTGWATIPRFVRWVVWCVAALFGYNLYQEFLSGSDQAIYTGIILLIAAVILLFVIRDASKPNRPTDD
ncbi:MAG: hypothetical protein C4583_11540 [Anaerolineaceae bacterium]|nr:MAG: hypothetical protein C4583_11540 [Anaerolineaceae bacterium]